jgi:hypothetical protein
VIVGVNGSPCASVPAIRSWSSSTEEKAPSLMVPAPLRSLTSWQSEVVAEQPLAGPRTRPLSVTVPV